VHLQARDGRSKFCCGRNTPCIAPAIDCPARVFDQEARHGYVDVVKEGQTVLTRDLDMVNGQAELALTATPDLAGTVDIHAYLFGQDARPVGDHRLVFVQPADELKIEATADPASLQAGRRSAHPLPRDQRAGRGRGSRAGVAGGG
jgi:hypothetical protein